MSDPVFNKSKMERLLLKDAFARILFGGLKEGTRRERLEVVFNSIVLEDAHMTVSYENR